MKRITFLIVLVALIASSCQNNSIEDKLKGVWFSESNSPNLFSLGFETFESDSFRYFPQFFPVLYDFKKNGVLLMRKFESKDTTFNWFMKSDSIVTIDNLDFYVSLIRSDSLKLIYHTENDYREISLNKPKKIKIQESEEEIRHLLLSNTWTNVDTLDYYHETNFQYFDNKTVVYRYKLEENAVGELIDNIQIETWGVAKYNDYSFVYNCLNMKTGNGIFDRMRQISSISDSTYSLIDSFAKTEIRYKRKDISDNSNTKRKILGKWRSKNVLNKSYGYYSKSAIKQGWWKIFEGDLELHITEDKLIFVIENQVPNEYNWQISKDSKTLVFETEVVGTWGRGIHVDCADIVYLNDNKLKIRLFNNKYFTDIDEPRIYVLNLLQEFERIE